MFCKYCGKQIAEDARFCPACGKDLTSNVQAPADKAPVPAKTVLSNNLLCIIAAGVIALFAFIGFVMDFVNLAKYSNGIFVLNIFNDMILMGGAALIVLSLFNILKKDNLFFAIGLFAFAYINLSSIFHGGHWLNWMHFLASPAFVAGGLYLILKGKPINKLIKMIASFVIWGLHFIIFVGSISLGYPVFSIISILFTGAAYGLIVFNYTPYKN
ncbi:MAG: zinc-ribbon domain-containing protein [Christensenellaceae bacterium]|nr:zinc-ribbon domain-containing protein [Christensenellaceae bacterium]